MTQQLLTTKNVAEMLNISVMSVYRHMQNGNINYLKIGRCRRIKNDEINKFIKLMERNTRANKTTKETV